MRFLVFLIIISSSYLSCIRSKETKITNEDAGLSQSNSSIDSLRKMNLITYLNNKKQLAPGLNDILLLQPSKCNVCSTKALEILQNLGDTGKSNIIIRLCNGEDYTMYKKNYKGRSAIWLSMDDKDFSDLGFRMAENWFLKVLNLKIISHQVID